MTMTYPGLKPAPRPGRCALHDREPLTPSGTCPWCRSEALAATPPPVPGPLRPARPGELTESIPTITKREKYVMQERHYRPSAHLNDSVRETSLSRTSGVTNTTLTTEEDRP
ncbi:hypothetical protein GCM10025883_22460 [Mobilicoccus caccae]|uniref:Uncharacterized protein n=1 Tax=Mobilicoccus caccae TaxID=1859295 RepID=A0ABQ6IT27_9MICO|nr:hypothetical protein GCM10025883_22460 [Mobilicoccus caccae]